MPERLETHSKGDASLFTEDFLASTTADKTGNWTIQLGDDVIVGAGGSLNQPSTITFSVGATDQAGFESAWLTVTYQVDLG
ncbi:hypothetical protein [Aestuariimicrobium ganziense]|uniref:hypothetical protein n=1 Tax=Aestuariimicrobium ganziense TaxID=2773677 RepID=UPI001944CCB5|nr:hypothetical protein [Aestuariimicrobium ganziense]